MLRRQLSKIEQTRLIHKHPHLHTLTQIYPHTQTHNHNVCLVYCVSVCVGVPKNFRPQWIYVQCAFRWSERRGGESSERMVALSGYVRVFVWVRVCVRPTLHWRNQYLFLTEVPQIHKIFFVISKAVYGYNTYSQYIKRYMFLVW